MVHYISTARCRWFGGRLLVALLTAWCGSQAWAEEAFEADAVSVSFDEGWYFLATSHPAGIGSYVRNPTRGTGSSGEGHHWTADGAGTNSSVNGAAGSLINREITAARTTPALTGACYTVAVTDAGGKASDLFALTGTKNCKSVASKSANDGTNGATGGHVKMKAEAILDYETSSKYVITVHAHKGDKVVDTLILTLNLNDVNEAPVVQAPFTYKQSGNDRSGDDLQPVGASRVYLNAGESTSISFNRMFRDPDATPEAFVPIGLNNLLACDNGTANTPGVDSQIHSSAAPSNMVGQGAVRGHLLPGTRGYSAAGDGNVYCVLPNVARGDPTPHPGQHVVKVSYQGSRLILTAYDQTTQGTYLAQVYMVTGETEAGAIVPSTLASTFAKITVIVKKGVNNPPAFAGGSVGFRTTVNEGTGEDALVASVVPGTTDATADDWNAGDLDTHDTDVHYKVMGTPCPVKKYATYTLTEGGSCWKYKDNSGNVSLTGALVDYEKLPAGKMATVQLQASDGYDTVTIPITVTVKDVNELETDAAAVKALGTVRLTNDEKSDPIELASLFIDPEGDPLTFSAYSNLREDLVKIEGRDLILTGKGATATAEKTYTITVTASDGKLSKDATFTLKVRAKNAAPSFEPAGVRSFGMSVAEDAPVGTFLATAITYLDADSADEVQATVDSELFEAVRVGRVDANENGKIDGGESALCELPLKMTVSNHCRKVASELGLRTKARLNAEQQDRHTLTLTLDDGWDKSGTVQVHVIVTDVNDVPMVKLDAAGEPMTIAEQVVAVDGSLMLAVGGYFTDEDDDRLKVDAASSMKQVATVMVSGLDQVTIRGLSEGMATITLTADDGEGGTVTLTFMVKVTANQPPVADKDAFMARLPAASTLNVGATFDMDLSGLFTDPDEGDMVGLPQAMTSDKDVLLVVVTNDGVTTLTLVGRASGMATLTLTAMDQAGNKTSVSQAITVNAAPAEVQPLAARTLDRVTPQVVDLDGLFTDTDDGAEHLVITATTVGADRATATVAGTTLTLAGVALGEVDIKLTATDPHGATATSTLTATVVNVVPTVAMDVAPQALDRIDPLTVDVSDTFVDTDGELATLEATVADERIVAVGAIDLADGQLTLTGLAVGETAVTVHATDHDGGQAMTTVTVAVVNVDPVVATAVGSQTLTRIHDLMYDASALFRDPDTDAPLALTVAVADPMIATAAVAGHQLTMEGLHVGSTTVTVTATDVDGGTATHEFVVAVENVTPTVAMGLTDRTFDRRAPLGLDLTGTFMDDDGAIRQLTARVADPSIATARVDDTLLTIEALAVGTTAVTLTATDDHGAMVSDTFAATVINLAPVVAEAVPDQTTTRIDDVVLDVGSTFRDPDSAVPLHVTVSVADGMYVDAQLEGMLLTLQGLQVGQSQVTLTARDADGGMATTTFRMTIENVVPEVAQALVDQEMDRRAPLTLDVASTFQDEDDGPTALSLTVMTADSGVAEAMLQGSQLTLTARAVGATEVMLTATDANGASVTDTFEVTVVNVAPVVAAAVMDQTITRVADVALDVSGAFRDPDTAAPLTLTVTTAEATLVAATLGTDHRLTLRGLAVGETVLTLTATDMDGGHVMDEVQVTVANVAPEVANSLSPVVLEVGGAAATPTIEGLFSDDGDPLTYTVATADTGIATAALAGTQARVSPIARGTTTLTITATDSHGGEATVRGSVTVGDGALKAVAAQSLAGFGRALLASASSSVGARLTTDARSADLTLDAWLDEWTPQDPAAASRTVAAQGAAAWQLVHAVNTPESTGVLAGGDPMAGIASGASGMDQLQSQFGQRFALNLGSSEDASRWSVWGDVDRQAYEGSGYDGTATSMYLGADVAVAEDWLVGLAVARQGGDSDYAWGTASQAMDMQLTTVLPYASYRPSERMSLWGVAGFGRGELDTTVAGTTTRDVSDLRSQLAMVGGEQALTRAGRFDLALRGDASLASLETDQGQGAADGLATDVHRFRLGLEGSFSTDTGEGGMLEPFGQVNVRTDGGDGETGSGLELAGGIRMTMSAFTLEAQGRTLALHGADDYRESGFSLLATLNPSAQATGVSVTIAPRWGADAVGTGILWEDTLRVGESYGVLTGMANGGAQASLETQLGYGLLVARERYLLTPFVDVRMSDGTRRELLVGASVRPWVRQAKDLDVRLAAGRVDERPGVSHSQVGLHATMRF